ncbi:MAG: GTP 3',8-cyclase MoaA [Gammaproteobacteria bacterium]|nr:GTP 3',8-cyclase MoaA [Gammaproteobacteria bacterium]
MTHIQQPATQLIDRFNRIINYVRLSVTDRCDLRCVYCMSEDMKFLPRAEILSLEEIQFIAATFVELGVTKLRVTGGEPLVRHGIINLLNNLGHLTGLNELVITTNGTHLESMAEKIHDAGVKRINISLDTLKPDRFRTITRIGDIDQVWRGIETASKQDFKKIKINSVILKHRNHDEVVDLVNFAIDHGFDISFIEEMPLGIVNQHNRAEAYYSSDDILADLKSSFNLIPTTESTGGPSVYHKVAGSNTKIGLISPHSHNFCGSCNRVRLTVEGRLLLCLGNEHSVDLKHVIRQYPGDSKQLKHAIISSLAIKPEQHEFTVTDQPVIFRHMSVTGG